MKKALLSFMLLFVATAMSAQTIVKGDMTGEGDLTVADVTLLVDAIVTNAPKQIISVGVDPYAVDNTLVAGTWYATDGSSFTLNADGSTDFPDLRTYKFRPYQGTLLFRTAWNEPLKKIVVDELESGNYMLILNSTDGTYTYYYHSASMGHDPSDYVDLGLPSRTLWATCNVGANSPEDYGDYFAWGEWGTNSYYHWNTYAWCSLYGSSYGMTKYCTNSSYGYNNFTDGKTELDLDDDAAYVNWGPAWRTPSQTQMDELRNNCTWTWTTMNNVNGYEVKGTNGNSIFLPAAGYRYYNFLLQEGTGYYWSRSLYLSEQSQAYGLKLSADDYKISNPDRCYGRSVRPVRNK